jgi:hypothetical protein
MPQKFINLFQGNENPQAGSWKNSFYWNMAAGDSLGLSRSV